eukprot:scaffold18795_cov129-Isochrysis_galbana.AAC.3
MVGPRPWRGRVHARRFVCWLLAAACPKCLLVFKNTTGTAAWYVEWYLHVHAAATRALVGRRRRQRPARPAGARPARKSQEIESRKKQRDATKNVDVAARRCAPKSQMERQKNRLYLRII